MPQTRMFRDRVVSMEQTLEGGEKNLELLKALCLEAMPEFTYREHSLDHERDLFVMILEAPDGRTKKVSWTRMVLFDAERIPSITGNPLGNVRAKILDFLKARSGRPEIVVTFRHLEEGWVDTPEPRRDRRRRRGRGGDRGRREGKREGSERPRDAAGREQAAAAGHPMAMKGQRPQVPVPRPQVPAARAQGPAGEGGRPQQGPGEGGGRRRRRMRRRRRGRGPGGSSPQGPASPPAAP